MAFIFLLYLCPSYIKIRFHLIITFIFIDIYHNWMQCILFVYILYQHLYPSYINILIHLYIRIQPNSWFASILFFPGSFSFTLDLAFAIIKEENPSHPLSPCDPSLGATLKIIFFVHITITGRFLSHGAKCYRWSIWMVAFWTFLLSGNWS